MCKIKKLAKRSDMLLSKAAGLSKVESFLVYAEKKSSMPPKFKIPKPIIPKLKIIKGGLAR